jgi:hypothetical protein
MDADHDPGVGGVDRRVAECVATLYYFSGTNSVTLGTLSFTVYP